MDPQLWQSDRFQNNEVIPLPEWDVFDWSPDWITSITCQRWWMHIWRGQWRGSKEETHYNQLKDQLLTPALSTMCGVYPVTLMETQCSCLCVSICVCVCLSLMLFLNLLSATNDLAWIALFTLLLYEVHMIPGRSPFQQEIWESRRRTEKLLTRSQGKQGGGGRDDDTDRKRRLSLFIWIQDVYYRYRD